MDAAEYYESKRKLCIRKLVFDKIMVKMNVWRVTVDAIYCSLY